MKEPNNPPAFPVATDNLCNHGMSMRDYFAAHAMQGVLAGSLANSDALQEDLMPEPLARWAFNVAEAMVAEMVKRNEKPG